MRPVLGHVVQGSNGEHPYMRFVLGFVVQGSNSEYPYMHSVLGYVVQGSNGEYPYMRAAERVELVAATKSAAAPGKLIIAGSGCECNVLRHDIRHCCTTFKCM